MEKLGLRWRKQGTGQSLWKMIWIGTRYHRNEQGEVMIRRQKTRGETLEKILWYGVAKCWVLLFGNDMKPDVEG